MYRALSVPDTTEMAHINLKGPYLVFSFLSFLLLTCHKTNIPNL